MKKSAIFAFLVLFAAAAVTPAYPEEMDPAEQTVPSNQPPPSFAELQVHPEVYQGQEIVLGGKVITARQYNDTTQIEVMQLPLGPGQQPEPNQALTQGRFLAFQKSGLTPVTVPPGTLVTVVGQIVGSAVADPAQTSSAYPVIEVKILTIWRSAEPVPAQVVPPAVAPVPPPAVAPMPPTPGVMDPYYTPYWDPAVGAWSWQPFWVFPWWARPAIVVSPSIVIVRRHRVPFGLPPRRIGPSQFVPRHGVGITRAPFIVPPIRSSHVVPPPAPHVVPPQFSHPMPPGARPEVSAGRSGGSSQHGRGGHHR